MKTTVRITDPLVLVGAMPATIELDFSALLGSDKAGLSNYIVGGRAYFEANLFGY